MTRYAPSPAPPIPAASRGPAPRRTVMPSERHDDEDLFADTRMSFGEHIEDLRTHLLSAIKGLLFFLVIGFVLDSIGYLVESDRIGIGYPMMRVITQPVRDQLIAFYKRRLEKLEKDAEAKDAAAVAATQPRPFKLGFSPQALAQLLGQPAPPDGGEVKWIEVQIPPLELYRASQQVN